ncbi:hypothetical protein [Methylopila sp. M107]|uniref:hypothetical protein n=1 Tax=Methylopila sp. M107 TaxID=1101190 RepID=UPI000378BECA|nr:hypothetical protein [Methylopila sp. M107]
MSINYISNDPNAPSGGPIVVAPSADRAAQLSSFDVNELPAEDVYETDTTDFVAWQAREAALRTLNAFEDMAGPIPGWRGEAARRRLDLNPNLGEELNAYYDRSSVRFYQFTTDDGVIFSGASTDVVAHEVGHAILDALRPDLWGVPTMEVTAFHEGFGDCIAIMTALSDRETREELLAADPDLSKGNFVEAIAEQLSHGIAIAAGPNHNAATPRRAANAFQWAFPQTLPTNGKPGELINESHSFGQLTSGCYYELIREIFLAKGGGQEGLLDACRIATNLLRRGVAEAPIQPRFLETVGRTMLLADRDIHGAPGGGGPHENFIRTAFSRHGIALSVTAFLAPRAAIGSKPKSQSAGNLTAKVKKELRSIMAPAATARLEAVSFSLAGPETSQVTSDHEVDLTGLSAKLENVKCLAPQVAIVGPAGGATAVLGTVASGATISNEVRSFVGTLVKHGQIDYGGKKSGPSKQPRQKAARSAGVVASRDAPTFALRKRGKNVFLERICFSCGCLGRTRLICVSD